MKDVLSGPTRTVAKAGQDAERIVQKPGPEGAASVLECIVVFILVHGQAFRKIGPRRPIATELLFVVDEIVKIIGLTA